MSTGLLDTHAHLTSDAFKDDLPSVLQSARDAGVVGIVTVSESISDAHAVLALANQYSPLVRAAIGLHPEHVSSLTNEEADSAVRELEQLARLEYEDDERRSRICAIGEVGLDFTPHVLKLAPDGEVASRERQRRVFSACLELARSLQLPLTVHSRAAGHHAVDLVESLGMSEHTVLHAFDGRATHAVRAAENGCHLSIPPCIVRSPQLQKTVTRLPLDKLLLETDSPVLGIEAKIRNEPAMVVKSLEMIAALKGVSVDVARTVLWEQSTTLFCNACPLSDGLMR